MGAKVYLDNVLFDAAKCSVLIRGHRALIRKVRRAQFIIIEKSELRTTKMLIFVGKGIDSRAHSMQNQTPIIAGAFKMWVKGIGTGKMANVELLRLLGV